jgi:hypothetical protein
MRKRDIIGNSVDKMFAILEGPFKFLELVGGFYLGYKIANIIINWK